MGSVGRDFTGQLIGQAYDGGLVVIGQVSVELLWSTRDPYAVTAIFQQGEDAERVPWTFDRGLMRGGLSSLRPVGRGDVQFRRQRPGQGGHLEMRLDSPEGVACVQLPAADVIAFLRETLDACPFGTESAVIDATLDAELKELLG
jgi:hypothetical protein